MWKGSPVPAQADDEIVLLVWCVAGSVDRVRLSGGFLGGVGVRGKKRASRSLRLDPGSQAMSV